jgi:oxygen-independent coproporphyrinogen-3 oxidase
MLDRDQLINRYEGRAPRYTSYPTAVQFTTAVDAARYRGWLAELPPEEPVSLYVHVPFCKRLCWYCGCNTRAVNHHEPVRDYLGWMLIELSMLQQALPATMTVGALHLGGGTPNMLTPDDLALLVPALRQAFRFAPGLEVAAELDPAVLTREWVEAAAFHGLTRASLGVQNLAPEVQQAVNRPERLEDIAACVGWLRDAGVGSVNFDLMYGLPRQTVANTLTTLDGLLPLKPDRIALFGYAHVPWMKPHQKLLDEAALPGPAERLDQSEAAADRLVAAGYVAIGLDHFALPTDELAVAARAGRLRRNFQGYTADAARTLLGLGASAIGALPQGFVQNQTQELAWRQALAAGDLPVARGVALTNDDRFRGEIIERLMCDFEVNLAKVCARHNRKLADLYGEFAQLEPFVRDGLAVRDGARVVVTPPGQILVRSICAVFDAHLAPEAGRHAKAI